MAEETTMYVSGERPDTTRQHDQATHADALAAHYNRLLELGVGADVASNLTAIAAQKLDGLLVNL